LYTIINQSIIHSFISHNNEVKNTENTVSANGRYNQAETALIVDLETQINQLQSYNSGCVMLIIFMVNNKLLLFTCCLMAAAAAGSII